LIEVEGFDQQGEISARGSKSIEITGEELSSSITLYPVEEKGDLQLLIQWIVLPLQNLPSPSLSPMRWVKRMT
jgi:hypothetical protein